MSGQGHNLNEIREGLEQYLQRVEKLVEARNEINDDIKLVKTEVKANGYDLKTFGEMLRLRALDRETRREREDLRDTYMAALGLC